MPQFRARGKSTELNAEDFQERSMRPQFVPADISQACGPGGNANATVSRLKIMV
jgi:hypothetical protein